MQFAGKTVVFCGILVLFFTADVVYCKGKGGQKTIRIKAAQKTILKGKLTTCTDFACKQLCQNQLGNEAVDIMGHCDGPLCKCDYREPCNIRKCNEKCEEKAGQKNMVNAKGECQRTDCICTLEGECNRKKCDADCKSRHRQHGAKAKGLCVDNECTCRFNN